jgi:hypothetical protein
VRVAQWIIRDLSADQLLLQQRAVPVEVAQHVAPLVIELVRWRVLALHVRQVHQHEVLQGAVGGARNRQQPAHLRGIGRVGRVELQEEHCAGKKELLHQVPMLGTSSIRKEISAAQHLLVTVGHQKLTIPCALQSISGLSSMTRIHKPCQLPIGPDKQDQRCADENDKDDHVVSLRYTMNRPNESQSLQNQRRAS